MAPYVSFLQQHELAIFIGYSAVVSMLPSPRDDERWYGFVYNVLHAGAANIAKVIPALRIERKP